MLDAQAPPPSIPQQESLSGGAAAGFLAVAGIVSASLSRTDGPEPARLRLAVRRPALRRSLGVILYVMLSGRAPFRGPTDAEAVRQIMAGQFDTESAPWPTISAEAIDLVRRLLVLDPKV